MQDISDKDLLQECLEGKPWAWDIFYQRFKRLILSVIKGTVTRYKVNLTTEDQKDCEQFIWTSFLEKDFDKLRRWQERCSLATWLRVCSCNATINYLKLSRNSTLGHTSLEDQPPSTMLEKNHPSINPEKEAAQHQLLTLIVSVIESELSNRERFFAALYWFDELSFDEISKIMDISIPNLHLLKHRIIKKIKRSMP